MGDTTLKPIREVVGAVVTERVIDKPAPSVKPEEKLSPVLEKAINQKTQRRRKRTRMMKKFRGTYCGNGLPSSCGGRAESEGDDEYGCDWPDNEKEYAEKVYDTYRVTEWVYEKRVKGIWKAYKKERISRELFRRGKPHFVL